MNTNIAQCNNLTLHLGATGGQTFEWVAAAPDLIRNAPDYADNVTELS